MHPHRSPYPKASSSECIGVVACVVAAGPFSRDARLEWSFSLSEAQCLLLRNEEVFYIGDGDQVEELLCSQYPRV